MQVHHVLGSTYSTKTGQGCESSALGRDGRYWPISTGPNNPNSVGDLWCRQPLFGRSFVAFESEGLDLTCCTAECCERTMRQ